MLLDSHTLICDFRSCFFFLILSNDVLTIHMAFVICDLPHKNDIILVLFL